MEIIKLNKGFKEEFFKVWVDGFGNQEDFEKEFCMRFFNQEDLWEQAYGWIDDEKLVSTYLSLNVDVRIRGKEFKAHYPDGICTLPEYRNRGLTFKQMLNDAKRCRENNISIMLLDPSRDSFYRKFGFEFALDRYRVNIPREFCSETKDISNYKVRGDFLYKDEKLQRDYKEINKWLWDNSRYNEMKWPKCYEDIKFLNYEISIVVVYDDNDNPIAYALYTIEKDKMYIESFRYINLQGFYGIKSFILNVDKKINEFWFLSIPEDFPLDLIVKHRWGATKCITTHRRMTSRMARIIDFKGLLENLIASAPRKPISIYIEDEVLPENTGVYVISTEGQVIKEASRGYDVQATISDIVPLLTGLKSAEELYFNDKLKVKYGSDIYQSPMLVPDVIKDLGYILPKEVTFSADDYLAP